METDGLPTPDNIIFGAIQVLLAEKRTALAGLRSGIAVFAFPRRGRPDDQNEYTRENHYVWQEGDAKRPLLVSLYRGHPQPNPPLPDCDYKNLIVEGARHWKLPAEYIRELESIQTAP